MGVVHCSNQPCNPGDKKEDEEEKENPTKDSKVVVSMPCNAQIILDTAVIREDPTQSD